MPSQPPSPRCAVIDSLRPQDKARLLARAVPRRLTRGERLYLAGEELRRLHVIVSGVIKLSASDGDGHETILGLAFAGEIIGEVAAVDRLPHHLGAVAAVRSYLLGFDADLFVSLLLDNPPAALALSRQMAGRNHWTCQAALERSASEVPVRLAARLIDLAGKLGREHRGAVELEMPLSQADLGRLAGMCRESVCKTMRSFRESGLVEYRGRRLRILRPETLERISFAEPGAALCRSTGGEAPRRSRSSSGT